MSTSALPPLHPVSIYFPVSLNFVIRREAAALNGESLPVI